VRNLIAEDVREKKLRVAMADEFAKIQDASTIDNYLAGTTQSSKQERGMFQRVSGQEEIDPTVPQSSRTGPAPHKLPNGMKPGAPPATPLFR